MRNEATSSKSNILRVNVTFDPEQRRQQASSDGAFCQVCVSEATPTPKPHWSKIQTSFNGLLRSISWKYPFLFALFIRSHDDDDNLSVICSWRMVCSASVPADVQHLTLQWNSQCFPDFVRWRLWSAVRFPPGLRVSTETRALYVSRRLRAECVWETWCHFCSALCESYVTSLLTPLLFFPLLKQRFRVRKERTRK